MQGWLGRFYLLLLVVLAGGQGLGAQEISYKHYTLKEGMPGSAVYQVLKDHAGFLWFATNQGVARFDGSTFRYFTKDDGLPSNDVIKLYEDKHGNIWFISTTGSLSVMHQGKIKDLGIKDVINIVENTLNDSIYLPVVTNFDTGRIVGHYQSANISGNWVFQSLLTPAGPPNQSWTLLRASSPGLAFYFQNLSRYLCLLHIKTVQSAVVFPVSNVTQALIAMPLARNTFYCLTADKQGLVFANIDSLYCATKDSLRTITSWEKLLGGFNAEWDLNYMYCENDTTLWICTRNKGLVKVSNFMQPNRSVGYFFPHAFSSSITKDDEGGYWVTTLNDGVYYIRDQRFFNLNNVATIAKKDIKSIHHINDGELVAGLADGTITRIAHAPVRVADPVQWARQNNNNRVLDLLPYKGGLLAATDRGAFYFTGKNWSTHQQIHPEGGAKGLQPLPNGRIMLAMSSGVRFDSKNIETDTEGIYFGRTTCAIYFHGNAYWGTPKGLYCKSGDSIINLGAYFPSLSGMINHIVAGPDSAIWVSTSDSVVVLNKGRAHSIGKAQRLVGQQFRHILLVDSTAWVSTDKGIARIDYHWQGQAPVYRISYITESDGLVSNDVNQTAVSGKHVWVATSKGISYFPSDYVSRPADPPVIYSSAVAVGNKEIQVSDTVMVRYPDNNVRISYSAIAYRSGGQISYEYRLSGEDSSWKRMLNNSIEFASLPFGELTVWVRTVDRWGQVHPHPKPLLIIHEPPFWKTTWFVVLLNLLAALLLGAVFLLIYRTQQRKKEQSFLLTRKMGELEMQALRSQMNPHFIFNCLSSIQRYILQSDTTNANLYLHKFSSLIRKILHYSSFSTISLEEEIKVLELYLSLEKMRMGDRMDYEIQLADNVLTGNIYIPCMIIQPYVENAVMHGVSPLRGRQGYVRVRFEQLESSLECYVEDNGLGILSSTSKRTGVDEYDSKGATITANRIQTINAIQPQKIKVEVIDRSAIDPSTTGTIVHLSFPLSTD